MAKSKQFNLLQFSLVIFFMVLTSALLQAQPTPPEDGEWILVPELTDEFNDTLDRKKWFKTLWNYGEPVNMKRENSGVENGNLWIKATFDSTNNSRWFETSRIQSLAQINYPMYTECRMRTAHISAYNTFWMNNGNIVARDEIDMCENNSKPSDLTTAENRDRAYTNHSQYFLTVNSNDERAKANFDNRNLSEDNPLRGVKWNEAYHVIGVWWKDANTIQFYLDGELSGRLLKTNRSFTRKLNLIWDLWTIDAQWSGGIAAKEDLLNDSINTMYVDWVHTYQLKLEGDEDSTVVPVDTVAVNDSSEVILGLSNQNTKELAKLYPNPVRDMLTIEILSSSQYQSGKALFYTNAGAIIKSIDLYGIKTTVNTSGMASGIYTVKILSGNVIEYLTFLKE